MITYLAKNVIKGDFKVGKKCDQVAALHKLLYDMTDLFEHHEATKDSETNGILDEKEFHKYEEINHGKI